MGMSERSLRLSFRVIIDAVAAADEDALDQLIAKDIVDHNAVPGQEPGRDGIVYWMTTMHAAFADLTGIVEDTVVEGDRIAARVTWHGTHRGDFVGVPGTGAPVVLQSVQIVKFADGMVSEWWERRTSSASSSRLVRGWPHRGSSRTSQILGLLGCRAGVTRDKCRPASAARGRAAGRRTRFRPS